MEINKTVIDSLQSKINRLEAENKILKKLLDDSGIRYAHKLRDMDSVIRKEKYDADQGKRIVWEKTLTKEMIELFMSRFYGRPDVFAKRFVSKKTGKPGYGVVCQNKFNPRCHWNTIGKMDCSKCDERIGSRLSRQDIIAHLLGKDVDGGDVVGVYPIFPNNTCRFLVFDFDNHDTGAEKEDFANIGDSWQEEVDAMRKICSGTGMDPLIERSRSGRGAHIWFFFDEAIPASLARRFGSALLDRGAMFANMKSFKYYDRMLPAQDYVKEGGLGNLIALPLQGKALREGNSAFIDENWNAYPDQWGALREKPLLSREYIEEKIREWNIQDRDGMPNSKLKGNDKPWESSAPFRSEEVRGSMKVTLADGIYVETENLSDAMRNSIRRMAAFRNTDFFKKQAMGLSNFGNSSWIYMGEDVADGEYIRIPRGLSDELMDRCTRGGIDVNIEDKRQLGTPINVTFNGELRTKQKEALDAMLQNESGILLAAPGFGKTVVGSALIAKRKVNTLILLESAALIDQWMKSLEQFLEIGEELPSYKTKSGRTYHRKSLIGRLKGQHDSTTGIIDIAMVGSVIKKGVPHERLESYGLTIVDECHHIAQERMQRVLSIVKSKYVYGMTATNIRADGLEQINCMYAGPIRFKYTSLERANSDGIARFVIPRFTSAVLPRGSNEKVHPNDAYEVLRNNEKRDELIINDVAKCIEEGRTPVVLSKYRDHSKRLYDRLSAYADHVILLLGGKAVSKSIEEMKAVPENESMILVATGQLVGEGFDYPRLDTLIMATPIAFKGIVEQFAGRLDRSYPGKSNVCVYDYVDIRIKMFSDMYKKRIRAYKKIGYELAASTDRINGIEENTVIRSIYNYENYREPYEKDLLYAKTSIVISSSAIGGEKVSFMIELLSDSIHRGVEVTIITWAPDSYGYGDSGYWMHLHEEMRQAGFIVHVVEEFCECFTIIDREIVWYGSMNFLSKAAIEDNLMRVKGKDIAEELLELTYGRDREVISL